MENVKNSSVVNLYFDKKKQEINDKYDKEGDELISSDVNIVKIKNALESAIAVGVADEVIARKTIAEFYGGAFFSIDTKILLDAARKAKDKELSNLMAKKLEVNALLEGCISYDDELNILKGYGIVAITDGGVTMK